MAVSNNEIKRARSLQQKKFRDQTGLFIVEGEKMVETLNPRYREEKAQKQDIANLKSQMGNIESTMGTMMTMMQNLQKSITASSKSSK